MHIKAFLLVLELHFCQLKVNYLIELINFGKVNK